MKNIRKQNQGFSLIELLISMALLSIVMVMVVSFMGSSQAAYRKTRSNLNLQTEAMQVVEQMSDTMMQASYVRIATKDTGMYYVSKGDITSLNKRKVEKVDDTKYKKVEYDFVPDNYANYAWKCNMTEDGREVILDLDNVDLDDRYRIVNRKDEAFPLSTDADYVSGSEVRSFRALRPVGTDASGNPIADDYRYVKPEFIYLIYQDSANVKEVNKQVPKLKADGTPEVDVNGDPVYEDAKDASGNPIKEYQYATIHVIYHITDITDTRNKSCSIYMYKETAPAGTVVTYKHMKDKVLTLLGKSSVTKQAPSADEFTKQEESSTVIAAVKDGVEGLVTDNIKDFYISADAEGNSLLANILFQDSKYEYNAVESINFRNSSVLSVRPQKLLKRVEKSGAGSPSTSTSTTP